MKCDLCKHRDVHSKNELLCDDCAEMIRRLLIVQKRMDSPYLACSPLPPRRAPGSHLGSEAIAKAALNARSFKNLYSLVQKVLFRRSRKLLIWRLHGRRFFLVNCLQDMNH